MYVRTVLARRHKLDFPPMKTKMDGYKVDVEGSVISWSFSQMREEREESTLLTLI